MATLPEAGPDYVDPLGGLPSLLSLTRRVAGTAAPRLERSDIIPALSVDPVLLLRALRGSNAPILGSSVEHLHPDSVLSKLGSGALLSMVQAPAPQARDLGSLFRLWLHAVASAVAARSLARIGTLAKGVDPDEAHACGLLHDLPLWGHLCPQATTGTRSHVGVLEWGKLWRLPEKVQTCWLAAHCGTSETHAHQDLVRVVVAGEAVAILAGYTHPGSTSRVEVDLVKSLAGDDLAGLVDQVRVGVRKALARAHIDLARLERSAPRETLASTELRSLPRFEDGIVKLQELGGSEHDRLVLTSLVAAVCHYLRFDRSFFVQWIGKGQTLLIQTKYDRTAVPVGGRLVVPSAAEAALMGRVAGLGRPEVLGRQQDLRFRLLDHLASDSVLVVPVFGGSTTHGLLLLDGSYSVKQGTEEHERTKALAMAGVCGQTMTTLVLKKSDLRSRKEAQTDSLTGLLNRRAALGQLEREIHRLRRREQPMAVLMLDLDHFKETNDTYGHLTGDRVLARVGQVLCESLRGSDVAARYGGEEFLVIQYDTTIEDASIVAARIYKGVEAAGRELDVPITISIGLTDLRPDDTVESLLKRADQALYASKHRGRNRFSIDSIDPGDSTESHGPHDPSDSHP